MAKITLESLQKSEPSNKSMSARCIHLTENRKTARIRFQMTVDGVVGDPWLESCPVVDIAEHDVDGTVECWVTVQQTNRKTKEVNEKSYIWRRA